ncbi:pilus assembly PilX family protein [Magnetococcales bacterium HHB-1]
MKTHDHERGSALLISLILLIIVSLLGLQNMNVSIIDEKMSKNSQEINVAFQDAEAALRAGENWLESYVGPPTPPTAVSSCSEEASPCNLWSKGSLDTDGNGTLDYRENLANNNWWESNARSFDNHSRARYLIEERTSITTNQSVGNSLVVGGGNYTPQADTMYYYTITARGSGETSSTTVVIQSVYAKAFQSD